MLSEKWHKLINKNGAHLVKLFLNTRTYLNFDGQYLLEKSKLNYTVFMINTEC